MTSSSDVRKDRVEKADDPFLEDLVVQCLDIVEDHGTSSLSSFFSQYPEYEARLRKRLSLLVDLNFLDVDLSQPDRMGDFRILGRLGGGGMGVVYLAKQESLGRQVALKLVRPDHLYFPGAHQRFRREVLAAARLQHPGIVPIYAVGAENGVPFFAMEYVAGCTLAQVLESLKERPPSTLTGADFASAMQERLDKQRADMNQSAEGDPSMDVDATSGLFSGSWPDTCFRIVREVTDALEHAHRRGILHRDLKPSNIMVTPSGRVMLFDFGLASAEGTSKLTRSGSQPGSLPYMSPEQIRAARDEIDRRTDIYSLGVTLYEMLSLKLPYEEAEAEKLRQAILNGNPPQLRDQNVAISKDAETVCMAAMAVELHRRYSTAADFARDIEHILERRPIEAQRASSWFRLQRWAERHPTSALAVILTIVLVAVVPALFLYQQYEANQAQGLIIVKLKEANRRARDAANEAKDEADTATRAVNLLLRFFKDVDPVRGRASNLLASELLRRNAAGWLGDELAGKSGLAAQLYTVLGQLYKNLGMFHEAEPILQKALEAHERKEELDLLKLAQCRHALAYVLQRLGRFAEAEIQFEQALECLQADPEVHATTIAVIAGDLGSLKVEAGFPQQGESQLREAVQLLEQSQAPAPMQRMNSLYSLAKAIFYIHNTTEVERLLLQARSLVEERYGPEHPIYGSVVGRLGLVLMDRGEYQSAESYFDDAYYIFEKRLGIGHVNCAEVYYWKCQLFARQGRLEEAWQAGRKAVDLYQDTFPEGSYVEGLASAELAETAVLSENFSAAELWMQRAEEIFMPLVDSGHPELLRIQVLRAEVLQHQGQQEDAWKIFHLSRERLLQRLPADSRLVRRVDRGLLN